VPLLDEWAEAYMGKYGRLRRITTNKRFLRDPKKARQYFKTLLTRIKAMKLPKDSYLKSIQDDISVLIRQTMYMLTLR
jgi:hypothetical protein